MEIKRSLKKVIRVGRVAIGGKNPVVIQSMAKARTSDVDAVLKQIAELDKAGCQIVRLAVKDEADAKALKKIKRHSRIPLVADIHFDYRLALLAVTNGADKIRLNPGNIYKNNEIREVVSALKSAKIPLRIGLNSGSVRQESAGGMGMPDRLAKSALAYIRKVEGFKFYDIIVSLKASNVLDTVCAYRKLDKACDYPLHLGVTASGPAYSGIVKSSIAVGALLLEGIGDTIRISLTDNPVQEVYAARAILESLGLRSFGPEIISCPTCGRCEVDLAGIVRDLQGRISSLPVRRLSSAGGRRLKVAVMGCIVNGPGEAKEADLGIAFGKKEGLLFKNGKAARKVSYAASAGVLLRELKKHALV